MHDILTMVGLPELPMPSLVILMTIVLLAGMLFGWIADLLLGENAFGIGVNTGLVLVGAFCGAWLWQRYGFPTRFDPAAVRAAIAMSSGLLLLLFLAVVRP